MERGKAVNYSLQLGTVKMKIPGNIFALFVLFIGKRLNFQRINAQLVFSYNKDTPEILKLLDTILNVIKFMQNSLINNCTLQLGTV